MSASEPAVGDEADRAEPVDLRLVPLALAAWAGAWWGTAPGLRTAVVAGVVALGAVLWQLRRARAAAATAMVLCLVGSATIALARSEQLAHSRAAELAGQRAMAVLVVQLDADPVLHPRHGVLPPSATAAAHVVLLEGRGLAVRQRVPVLLRASGDLSQSLAAAQPGARLRAEGRLAPPDPGEQLAAVVTLRAPPTPVAPPGAVARAVNHLRGGLRAAMRHSPSQQAGLLPSLVVGDTSHLDPTLSDSFKATGLTHLTAVSGTNLTLMLVFLLGLARWLGVRGWWVRGVGLFGVVAFVVVCRAEPSVLRAGAMGLVALAGIGIAGGRARGMRHLCVAVWMLVMVEPWLARSAGFALSTLATGGILWWGGRWTAAMGWAPRWLAESIAVPLAAQLATQAVVTSISGSISVVGLVANALAGPFVGPATVLGLVAALVAVVSPWLAALLGWVAGWCVQPIIWIAVTGGALPAATWRWPGSPALVGLLAVLCLVLAPLVPRALSRPWVCLLLAAALVVGCLHQPRPLGWPGAWQVAFCDVGQGDATVLRAAPGEAVVVDVGPEPAHTLACLHQLGIRRIPLLVLTHYHDDHIGGLDGVLDAVSVGAMLVNPVTSPAAGARHVAELAQRHAIPTAVAAIGQQLQAGQVSWQTVGVGAQQVLGQQGEGESSAENDTSIVGVAQAGGVRVVIGGDVEPAGQQRVVAAGWQPHVSVLKMPHHGSSRQDHRFWCDSSAVLAVASAGYRNDYGHPAPAALRLAGECGMQVARTDLQGTVTVWLDGSHLQVRSQRDGPP